MSTFLYFIEGNRKSIDLAGVRELGLGYAFDGAIQCSELYGGGPLEMQSGLCFGSPRGAEAFQRIGYFPDRQRWLEIPQPEDAPRLAVGIWTESPPTPADLARPKQISGLNVTLRDNAGWMVPNVRRYDNEAGEWRSELPSLYALSPEGKMVPGDMLPELRYLWDITAPIVTGIFEAELEGKASTVSDEQLCEVAVALLQCNYYVNAAELVLMQAFENNNSSDVALVVTAACQKDRLVRWIAELAEKKTDESPTPPGSTTSGGEEDSRRAMRLLGAI